MQLEVVYEKIFERFPDTTQSGDIIYTPNNFVNAIQELPVSFTPKNKSNVYKKFDCLSFCLFFLNIVWLSFFSLF